MLLFHYFQFATLPQELQYEAKEIVFMRSQKVVEACVSQKVLQREGKEEAIGIVHDLIRELKIPRRPRNLSGRYYL